MGFLDKSEVLVRTSYDKLNLRVEVERPPPHLRRSGGEGGSKDQFRIFFGSVIYCSKFNVLSDAIKRISRNDPILPKIDLS